MKDASARCSRWSQACWLLLLLVSGTVVDEMGNGGPLASREGWLLLLRLRNGVASAGSTTAAEEGYGCEGGYSWASGSAHFWLLC
ncbi:hypothetical protein NC652_034100 [Populus alba x Populus x berolinensis]|nr:hypothetical protein NC652_034100 [Populus alba x Populus x berolinensis]